MAQQGDVRLFQTDNEGDVDIEDGVISMDGGLETSAYLALFGGNEDDDGRNDNSANWWANIAETQPSRQYRSETQNLLQSLPAISVNLFRIEDAAKRDLAYFIEEKIASSLEVSASIPGINRIKIVINIEAIGEESNFEFTENWKTSV